MWVDRLLLCVVLLKFGGIMIASACIQGINTVLDCYQLLPSLMGSSFGLAVTVLLFVTWHGLSIFMSGRISTSCINIKTTNNLPSVSFTAVSATDETFAQSDRQ